MSTGAIRLSELLAGTRHAPLAQDPVIQDISSDSRQLARGGLFVALRGERVDGRDFIATVLEAGAVAVLVDGDEQPALKPGQGRQT